MMVNLSICSVTNKSRNDLPYYKIVYIYERGSIDLHSLFCSSEFSSGEVSTTALGGDSRGVVGGPPSAMLFLNHSG